MARIRTIKPGFFTHAELYDAERASGLPLRLAFAGLWTVADREGRFKWRPREIKLAVLPFDDVDMAAVLDALVKYRFIFKYKCVGEEYGFIPSFASHQHVNPREALSTIPSPTEADASPTRKARVKHANPTRLREEGKGTEEGKEQEGKGTEGSIAPQSVALPPFILLTTNRNEPFPVSEEKVLELQKTFPAADVRQELREMRQWCTDNPTRRKTWAGMGAFMSRWLGKEQDRGGRQVNGTGRAPERGKGIRSAAEHALAAVKRAQGDDPGNGTEPSTPSAIRGPTPGKTGSGPEMHAGGDHPRIGNSGHRVFEPVAIGSGAERPVSGVLPRLVGTDDGPAKWRV